MAFLSAPITSYLYVPLAIFEPHFAAILFKAAGTICLWLGLFLLYRHLRNMITDPSWYLPFKVHIPGYPPTYSDNIRPFVPGYPPSFDALP